MLQRLYGRNLKLASDSPTHFQFQKMLQPAGLMYKSVGLSGSSGWIFNGETAILKLIFSASVHCY